MLEIIVSLILALIAIYLVCGLLFACYFLAKGIYKIDEGAYGSPLSFKILIAPGVIVFWAFLFRKILRK